MIESELFGYREGAFTGARKGGARGKIAQAHRGTLFLDEIGDMALPLQSRLLRVLAEGEVAPLGGDSPLSIDIQVISATHQELRTMVERGQFRLDLFHRLSGLALTLPPLRDRDDKQKLIEALLDAEAREQGAASARLTPEALDLMLAYAWPGNIRELRSVLRTALALSDGGVIDVEHLPSLDTDAPAKPSSFWPQAPDADFRSARLSSVGDERDVLVRRLRQAQWNVSRAARNMCTSRSTLYRRMRELGIATPNREAPVFDPPDGAPSAT